MKGGPSPNPAGRPPDLIGSKLKMLTAEEFAEIANLVVKNDLRSLQLIAKEPGASALKVWIASVVVKAIQKGDYHGLDVILNRIVGKVKDRVEVTGKDGGPLEARAVRDVQKLLSDPESFKHLNALEGKLNGPEPSSSNDK
jgi:hypothetical protein